MKKEIQHTVYHEFLVQEKTQPFDFTCEDMWFVLYFAHISSGIGQGGGGSILSLPLSSSRIMPHRCLYAKPSKLFSCSSTHLSHEQV